MSYLESDDTYKPHIRLTETKSGFGSKGEASGSYKGANPERLIQLVEKDLVEFRSCVNSIGTRHDSTTKRQELSQLKFDIKAKLESAKQELDSKRARGEDNIGLKRVYTQLKNQCDEFEKLLNTQKQKLESTMAYESIVSDSFVGSSEDVGGEDVPQQEALETQESPLEIIEQQAGEIRELETDITDLHEIHRDLHGIVVDQGEHVDRIEIHTEKAGVRVEKGLVNTKQAVEINRQNKNLIIVAVSIGSGIGVIILIIIIVLIAVLSSN